MDLNKIVNSKLKLEEKELKYLINGTYNQSDYLLLNYMEQRILEIHGNDFIKNNTPKIQYIISIILQKNTQEYIDFYNGSFEQYMQSCNRNAKAIPGFNIIFITLTHIAIKIIRKNKVPPSMEPK